MKGDRIRVQIPLYSQFSQRIVIPPGEIVAQTDAHVWHERIEASSDAIFANGFFKLPLRGQDNRQPPVGDVSTFASGSSGSNL